MRVAAFWFSYVHQCHEDHFTTISEDL